MKKSYDDIIDLPHHVSTAHPQMSLENRAAQFSPFAAVVGYDAAIEEKGRLTESRISLSDTEIEEVNRVLQYKISHINESPIITLTAFREDELKEGGAYYMYSGVLKKYLEIEKTLVFSDGREIRIDDIISAT